MIVILILASLAAVYYIAPMAEPAGKSGRQPSKPETAPAEGAVLTPGLLELGRALDQYRHVRPSPSGHMQEARSSEPDRV